MGKMKETTTLRYIFVAIMVVILILRVLGVTVLAQEIGLGEGLMVLAILFAVGIRIIGIVAALTQRVVNNNFIKGSEQNLESGETLTVKHIF